MLTAVYTIIASFAILIKNQNIIASIMEQFKKALFITIEGIDGSGKSTLAQLLSQRLKEYTLDVLLTREPSGSELGQKLRTLLKEKTYTLFPRAEYLLFAADRAQHIQEVINPALKTGKIVISDRFSDSSVVYQGYGRGLDITTIKLINTWATEGREPDITFYIEISLETAQHRRKLRNENDRFDRESRLFYEHIINGYEQLCTQYPRIIRLDGELSPEHITQKAYDIVLKKLKELND